MVLGVNSPHYGKEFGKEELREAKAEEVDEEKAKEISVKMRDDMYKLFVVDEGTLNRDLKCQWCGYKVRSLYVLASSKEEARRLYEKDAACVMCGDCIAEHLAMEDYTIEEGDDVEHYEKP